MGDFILAAGAGLAVWDAMSNHGTSQTISDNINTSMVMHAVTSIDTKCIQSVQGTQQIQVTGGSGEYDLTGSDSTCLQCLKLMNDIVESRSALEQTTLKLHPQYKPQTAREELVELLQTGGVTTVGEGSSSNPLSQLGACNLVCKSQIVSNIEQNAQYKMTQNCSVDSNLTNDMNQNLSTSIQDYMKNQQDVFGQFENLFTKNSQSLSAKLASSLTQNVETVVNNTLETDINNLQLTSVSGHSAYVANVQQSFNINSVTDLFATNDITNQLRQSATYSIAQSELNKNDSIGDLSKDVLQIIKNLTDILENTVTRSFYVAVIVILGLLIAFFVLFASSQKFRKAVNSEVDKGVNEAQEKWKAYDKAHPKASDKWDDVKNRSKKSAAKAWKSAKDKYNNWFGDGKKT